MSWYKVCLAGVRSGQADQTFQNKISVEQDFSWSTFQLNNLSVEQHFSGLHNSTFSHTISIIGLIGWSIWNIVGDDECSLIAAFSSLDFVNVFFNFSHSAAPSSFLVRSSWSTTWTAAAKAASWDSPWASSRAAWRLPRSAWSDRSAWRLPPLSQHSCAKFITTLFMRHYFCDQTSHVTFLWTNITCIFLFLWSNITHTQHCLLSSIYFVNCDLSQQGSLSSFCNQYCDHNWYYTQRLQLLRLDGRFVELSFFALLEISSCQECQLYDRSRFQYVCEDLSRSTESSLSPGGPPQKSERGKF